MDMEQRGSGLVVPKTKPVEPPPRAYGRLEITDEEDRERAKKAFVELWHALGLYDNSQFDDQRLHGARRLAWDWFSTMLLGDEAPECEQLT